MISTQPAWPETKPAPRQTRSAESAPARKPVQREMEPADFSVALAAILGPHAHERAHAPERTAPSSPRTGAHAVSNEPSVREPGSPRPASSPGVSTESGAPRAESGDQVDAGRALDPGEWEAVRAESAGTMTLESGLPAGHELIDGAGVTVLEVAREGGESRQSEISSGLARALTRLWAAVSTDTAGARTDSASIRSDGPVVDGGLELGAEWGLGPGPGREPNSGPNSGLEPVGALSAESLAAGPALELGGVDGGAVGDATGGASRITGKAQSFGTAGVAAVVVAGAVRLATASHATTTAGRAPDRSAAADDNSTAGITTVAVVEASGSLATLANGEQRWAEDDERAEAHGEGGDAEPRTPAPVGAAGRDAETTSSTIRSAGVEKPAAARESEFANRVARVLEIHDEIAAQPVTRVLLRLDEDGGAGGRISVGLRGAAVEAAISLSDPAAATRLQGQVSELSRALQRQGLDSGSLTVATAAPGKESGLAQAVMGTNNPDSAGAGRGWSFERGAATEEQDDPRASNREDRDPELNQERSDGKQKGEGRR